MAYGVYLLNKCPFCGAELPEEAVFCLNCSSILNKRQEITVPDDKTKNRKPIFSSQKISIIIAVFIACAILLVSCFSAIQSIKKQGPQDTESTTTPTETIIVPITEANGEIATNNAGEELYKVTEITEATTKKSFLEILLNKDEKTDESETEQQDKTDAFEKPSTENEGTTAPIENTTDNKNDTTSDITVNTIENQTTKNTNQTATKPETSVSAPAQSNAADFQYIEANGEIKVTKYIGNNSIVTVPSYIDGKHVAFLGENVFSNNSNIKKIIFEGTTSGTDRFYLPKGRTVFNNLPNLTSITFPYETYYRMTDDSKNVGNDTFYDMITNCPNLSSIYFTEKVNPDYSSSMLNMYSVDGVVFSRQNTSSVDSHLVYYPPAKTNSTYTIPSRVSQINKFAFQNNKHITSVHFSASTLYVTANFIGCSNLTSFTVDSGNPKLFAENGVLYTDSSSVNGISYKSFFYPPGKTDSSFTFNDEYNLSIDGYSFCGNPYLKTVKFCRGVRIDSSLATGVGKPTSLTTFMLNDKYTNTINTSKSAYTYTYY